MTVSLADSTVNAMRQKVRRLTASASESSLTTNAIDQALNTFYNNDFPYAVKIDQMRSVYSFFTQPYIDRYPIDVNYIQGIRSPFYVEGIQGTFMKDRQQFFNIWPRFPTLFNPASGDGVTQIFNFNIPGPFLRHEVVIGAVDASGSGMSVNDAGDGFLYLQVSNPQTSVPPIISSAPGMKNANTGNPGQDVLFNIGTVDYVTGNMAMIFPNPPASGTQLTVWVSQYQTGRPYSCLFWNNELTIRPVPKFIHKCELEVFLTPVQFMTVNDVPILNQWWQYLSYGASVEILRERQDTQGVEQLKEGMMRQEALVLERQSVEEIFQPNIQLFNATTQVWGGVNGIGYY